MVRPSMKNMYIDMETFPTIDLFSTDTVSQIQNGFRCSF